jgi:hypothetical protein
LHEQKIGSPIGYLAYQYSPLVFTGGEGFPKERGGGDTRKSGQGTSYLQETLPDVPWGKGARRRSCGKRLNPKPFNLTDKEQMASKTDEYLFKDITKGEGSMPAFERKLKEEERWMVIHNVRTFSGTGGK